MSETPRIDPAQHPMVLAATARLAGHGGWARLLEGKPLEDPADLADAALLVAAGVLRRTTGEGFAPVRTHPRYADPCSLADDSLAVLRRALAHAEGASAGWDAAPLPDQGRRDLAAARVLAGSLLPRLPSAYAALAAGRGRALEAGTAPGAVSQELCRRHPGTRATVVDVRPGAAEPAPDDALDDARSDLAWLPRDHLHRADLPAGLRRLAQALRPGGWLVAAAAADPGDAGDDFAQALARHDVLLSGSGGPQAEELEQLLAAAGLRDVRRHGEGTQVLVAARRP